MDEKEFIEGLKKIVWPSNLGYHDLLNIISADIKNKFVPIEIFAVDNLNPLEAVIKYLKENRKLKYSQIADLLERDDRVIWNTYNKIKIKISLSDKSTLLIPINTFQNKKLSILEVNKQIVEFSKLKESSQILNLKIAEVKVENLERVSLLLENNGKINIDDVMIRVNGDLGSTTIVADGIEPYTSKIVTEQIEFEKIGTIKSIDAIPISLENNQIYSISKDTTIKIEQEITDEACNADTDRDNIPDCADNCLGGKCKPKEPCKLINASWSSSKVYSGMPVSIIINGTNCLDELVDIEIYEADTFTFDDLLDPVIFDIPTNVNIENEVGIRELKLPFVEDLDGNDNIPEYRFIAKIETERIISNEVEVLNSDEIGIKPLIIPTKTNFNSFEDATFEYVFIDDEVFENLINKGKVNSQ